jgi:hypothetical protein
LLLEYEQRVSWDGSGGKNFQRRGRQECAKDAKALCVRSAQKLGDQGK